MTDFRQPIQLGQTPLRVGRLGIGSSAVTDARYVEEAVEQGANYLYWGTFRRPAFGRAVQNLARRNRDGVVLTAQSYSRFAWLLRPSLEVALRRLGLEYFDFLLLGLWNAPPPEGVIEAALRLRAQGKVRHLMLSTHNRPSLETHFREFSAGRSPFDAFMVRYNAVHRGAERDVFPHLPRERPPGLISYTATRWGHLLDPARMPPAEPTPAARDCYRFALSNPAVSMVLCSPSDRGQMQEALRALEAGPLDAGERARLERIGDHIYGRHRPRFRDGGDAEAGTA